MKLLLKEIEKVKSLLQRCPEKDLFFIKTLDGAYVWINTAAEKFIGKTLSEIFMMKNIWNDDLKSEARLLSGEIQNAERRYYIIRPADGKYVYINICKNLFMSGDTPVGFFISAHEDTQSNDKLVFLIELLFRQLGREKEYIIHSLNTSNNKIISDLMGVSERTAFQYRTNIMKKLNINNEEYHMLVETIDEIINKIPIKKHIF